MLPLLLIQIFTLFIFAQGQGERCSFLSFQFSLIFATETSAAVVMGLILSDALYY